MAAIGAKHMDDAPLQRLHRFSRLGTIDLRVDYLRPGIGSEFILRAEVLRLGSRVANTRMEFLGPMAACCPRGRRRTSFLEAWPADCGPSFACLHPQRARHTAQAVPAP